MSTSYSSSSTRPCIGTPPFRSISSAPITSLHPTSAAVPRHRRRPPPSSPDPDPVQQQHCHDPQKLTKQTNFHFFHQNCQTAAPTSSFLRRRSASRRPVGAGPLHLDQGHRQHHVISLKRSRPSFTAHCCSIPQNTMPPSPPVRARRPPHRRAPPSALSPTKLGTGKASPHFRDAHAHPSGPCSSAPRRDHEYPVTAAAIHRRRPCSTPARRAHHPPTSTTWPVGHAEPVHPRWRPRRRRERARADPPVMSGRVKGITANSFPVLRVHMQETKDPSVNLLVISCGQATSL
jgi:hypothetical protein